ncbi:cation-translocating P-type ATPase [Acetobacterium tundrae]|uniref:HAD-IC family P-type ATPase n=1 Tax=Acetobacterium tundrae TaxID=132932 RepID=A0ABR6WN52_9FIRM|nr:cation-translocating P-type ATPase [Acetobacterium tundrae]MBC3797866.1 HAD-IC family P-type ATPase [Acetobacterium tundrae]
MKEYLQTSEEVLLKLKSRSEGLLDSEAGKRLEDNGKNKLTEAKKDSLTVRFLNQLKDPMIVILMAAAIISGITAVYSGESFADVIIILAVVIINSVLGVYQESKAEKAIEALQAISAATSKVMREGEIQVVKSEDLVVGDVILLEAGDSIPGDARLLDSASLKIQEAALTGESVPVEKVINALNLGDEKDISLGDRRNMVYMGSAVVYGRGSAAITATGMSTEMGKIADAITQAKENQTPLQIKLNQLSVVLSWLVLGICVFIFGISLIRLNMDGGITGIGILGTFMVAVSLAVAAIPEGLAAVVTIVLSIGVTKMSKQNAIIRKLTAVETLGCTQVICSDKTGTLTQNKMTVVEHFGLDEQLLGRAMTLCNDAYLNNAEKAEGEPTEVALVNYGFSLGLTKSDMEAVTPRVGEAPFDSGRKLMSTVHQMKNGAFEQYTKGAPDVLISRCTSYWDGNSKQSMTDAKRQEIKEFNKSLADQALRVLSAAFRSWDSMPVQQTPQYLEHDLCFIGLTGMIDPIRPEVKPAIAECNAAGIHTVMITGDHKDTAVAIAKQLGIISDISEAITGAQLSEISDEQLATDIGKYSVYARVQPEHKVRIVKAWQNKGMIVAMTGDGVNDAPSIKTANIGIGMGITGTDVTKNVADMVLADDNFATIVQAVREGRRIYDNIRKAIQFLISSNLSEVLAIFVATLLGFVILKPVHLLWINLITDSFPAIALGMEAEEADTMNNPPRKSNEGVFAGGLGIDVIWQGVMVTIVTLAAYFIGHFMEVGVWEITNSQDGVTMAFLTLSMAEMFHSLNMRSRRQSIFRMGSHNKFLFLAMAASLLLTTIVIVVPSIRAAFQFEPISIIEYFTALGLAFLVIPIVEIVKFFQRKHERKMTELIAEKSKNCLNNC